jgi:hypothetical protein
MMPTRLLLCALGIVAAIGAAPSVGRPCSPPIGYSACSTLPQDGAVGLPTNARLQVVYDAIVPSLEILPAAHLTLETADGNPVEVDYLEGPPRARFLLLTLVPTAPLVAGATYRLVDRLPAKCVAWNIPDCLGEPSTIASFTVGDSADVTAPTFAGLAEVSSVFSPALPEATCGPVSDVRHALTWSAATDDGPAAWIHYDVYDGSGTLLGAGMVGELVRATQRCTGEPEFPVDSWSPHILGGPRFLVRAVDIAGNGETNQVAVDGIDCATFDPDGDGQLGTAGDDSGTAGDDAGVPSPDSGSPSGESDDGGGCSTGAGRTGTGAGGALLGALLLATRRRARR